MELATQQADTSRNHVAIALSRAQTELQDASKDATNPHFKSKYASLESVLAEARRVLPKHGLAFTQTLNSSADGSWLTTELLHISGGRIVSQCPLILSKQDMQGLGSAITYARRYGLAAILGIGQEDDDGNEASKEKPAHGSNDKPKWTPSDAQLRRLFGMAKSAGVSHEALGVTLKNKYGVSSTKDLGPKQYDEICGYLESLTETAPSQV